MTGTVFNIQKFSIHDRPGIRTTVFLKGCPLNCSWCHNPEKQIIWNKKSSMHCLKCIENCEKNAIQKCEENIITDPKRCIKCGNCISVCPVNARSFMGNEMNSDELREILKKDRAELNKYVQLKGFL